MCLSCWSSISKGSNVPQRMIIQGPFTPKNKTPNCYLPTSWFCCDLNAFTQNGERWTITPGSCFNGEHFQERIWNTSWWFKPHMYTHSLQCLAKLFRPSWIWHTVFSFIGTLVKVIAFKACELVTRQVDGIEEWVANISPSERSRISCSVSNILPIQTSSRLFCYIDAYHQYVMSWATICTSPRPFLNYGL